MIRLLSNEIGPKPLTTDFVGKRWAIPQKVMIREPKIVNTYLKTMTIPSFYEVI
jgi:hypothetical protein